MTPRIHRTLALIVLIGIACSTSWGGDRNDTFWRDPNSVVPAIPEGFGVNIHFTNPRAGEMKMLAESGVRWVRMDFKWDITETVKGSYDFAPYDRLMSALAR